MSLHKHVIFGIVNIADYKVHIVCLVRQALQAQIIMRTTAANQKVHCKGLFFQLLGNSCTQEVTAVVSAVVPAAGKPMQSKFRVQSRPCNGVDTAAGF